MHTCKYAKNRQLFGIFRKIHVTFEQPEVDKELLERKETALSSAIIRNCSKSVVIEDNRIVVEV